MSDDARISEIRRCHWEVVEDGVPTHCCECYSEWPCDYAFLLARLDALEELIDAWQYLVQIKLERDALTAENGYLREGAAESEAAVLRLTAERDESVANMTATAAAFARLQAHSEAWHDDSKRLHNEYMPTAAIMDEVLATRDRAIMDAWAERDAAQRLSAMTAQKFTEQLEVNVAMEAERDALASRLAAAEAALREIEDVSCWQPRYLEWKRSAQKVGLCPSSDLAVNEIKHLARQALAALAGSREPATTTISDSGDSSRLSE